ncbi:MAG: ElyC/SanA/YdcF family protein [Burkholderiales bacterium]
MILFRRRQVWLPTLWGALLMLAVAAALVVLVGLNAYDLLAPHQPARGPAGAGARTLVVEGWLEGDELRQAVAIARSGRYERVLTTGGPIDAWSDPLGWHNHARRAAAYLRDHGVDSVPVIAVETPPTLQDRTYHSAVQVRDWARRSGVELQAIDLFSVGVHMRRSRVLYRMALGDAVEVGAIPARPLLYDPQRWWGSSAGTKATMGETLSLAWTTCCFWPAAPR